MDQILVLLDGAVRIADDIIIYGTEDAGNE